MVRELFDQIESNETAARVNVASGFKLFLRALTSLPPYLRLQSLSEKRENSQEVLTRILKLTEVRIDTKFGNPFDTSLVAYLLILRSTYPDFALIGAEAVSRTQNCWWASRVAEEIYTGEMTKTDQACVVNVYAPEGTQRPVTVNTVDVGIATLLADYLANVSLDYYTEKGFLKAYAKADKSFDESYRVQSNSAYVVSTKNTIDSFQVAA